MTPANLNAVARVQARLEAAGAEVELAHFHRLSPDELTVLARLERGWGPHVVDTPVAQAVDVAA